MINHRGSHLFSLKLHTLLEGQMLTPSEQQTPFVVGKHAQPVEETLFLQHVCVCAHEYLPAASHAHGSLVSINELTQNKVMNKITFDIIIIFENSYLNTK